MTESAARDDRLPAGRPAPADGGVEGTLDWRPAAGSEAPAGLARRFELLQRLGGGSFGDVFRARDRKLGRVVAIKLPKAGAFDDASLGLFLHEARAAAALRHPRIVAVHEVGHEEGQPYIVADFIEGGTLADRMAARPFAPREAAALCRTIAEGLHYAHLHGIVHRDLKPANILLDSAGEPYITDFGVARSGAADGLADEGKVVGTPAYMSPEQARGESHRANACSDVYSLGVVLFELLTGERPFRGDRAALLRQVAEQPPPRPRGLAPQVPRDLETVCLKCLEKEPARRYASAARLAADLGRWLEGRPIEARPVGPAGRAWRWAARNRWTSGLASLAAILLLAIGAVATWGSVRTSRAIAAQQVLRGEAAGRRTVAYQQGIEARQNAYGPTIGLAYEAFAQAHAGEARRLLDRLAPPPGEKDLRDVEWWILQQLLHREAATLGPFDQPVRSLAPLPGGKTLAAAVGRDILLIDVARRRVGDRLSGHPGTIAHLAASPDGRWLAAGGAKQTVIWERGASRDGLPGTWSKAAVLDGFAPSFAPDTRRLALMAKDGELVLLAVGSWKPQRAFALPSGRVTRVAFSPDGALLAVQPVGNPLLIFDLATGEQKLRGRGESRVDDLAFSADGTTLYTNHHGEVDSRRPVDGWYFGKRPTLNRIVYGLAVADRGLVAAAGGDGAGFAEVRLFSQPGLRSVASLRGHADRVWSVAFLDGGRTLASGSEDGTIKLWDVAAEAAASERLLGEPIVRMAFSPDGRRLATVDAQKEVRLWDAGSGQVLRSWRLHSGEVHALRFSPDGRRLATAGADGHCFIVDTQSGRLVGHYKHPLYQIHDVAFSPDGAEVALGGPFQVRSADLKERRLDDGRHFRRLAYSPDGKRIYGVFNSVYVIDRPTGKVIAQEKLDESDARGLDVRKDGNRLLVLFERRVATVDPETLEVVQEWTRPRESIRLTATPTFDAIGVVDVVGEYAVLYKRLARHGIQPEDRRYQSDGFTTEIAISPDGNVLAMARGNYVRRFDGRSLRPMGRLGGGAVWAAAYAPDGGTLAAAGHDGVHLLATASGTGPGVLEGIVRQAYAVAFSPDGRWLAAAGGRYGDRSSMVALVDRRSGKPHFIRRCQAGAVRALAFSPDGQTLFTAEGGEPGSIGRRDAASRRALPPIPLLKGAGHALALSPDGRLLAVGCGPDAERESAGPSAIEVRDAVTGALVARLEGHAGAVRGLAFLNQQMLVSVSADRTLRRFDLTTQKPAGVSALDSSGWSLALSPSATRAAVGCGDGRVRLFDTRSWRQLCELEAAAERGVDQPAPDLPVRWVGFHPRGGLAAAVAAGSGDGGLRIWRAGDAEHFDQAALP